jgi:precorrin-6B methylase 2
MTSARLLPALLVFAAALPGGTPPAVPASAAPPAARYEAGSRTRDGIGKYYFGREISQVMGHLGAGWLERAEREEEERTDLLLETLRLRSGDVVADFGAGSGYFTWRIAQRVGPSGRVYAVEVQPLMLELLQANLTRRGLADRMLPVLGTASDPKLPEASCDLILLVDVYHELEFPFEVTAALARALKPGGRLVLVEYRGEDPEVPIKPLHKMTVAQVRRELAVHPLEFVENLGVLPRQHLLVFRRPAATR